MIPDINATPRVPDETPVEPEVKPSLTYTIEGGRANRMIDGLEAVKQAAYKRLMTEQGAFVIYPADYGLKTADLIGQDYDEAASKLRTRIAACLLQDDRITAVGGFVITRGKDSLTIGFEVDSLFGRFTSQYTFRG